MRDAGQDYGSDVLDRGAEANGIILGAPAMRNPAAIAARGLPVQAGAAFLGKSGTCWTLIDCGAAEDGGAAGAGVTLPAGGRPGGAPIDGFHHYGIVIDDGALAAAGAFGGAIGAAPGGRENAYGAGMGYVLDLYISGGLGTAVGAGAASRSAG